MYRWSFGLGIGSAILGSHWSISTSNSVEERTEERRKQWEPNLLSSNRTGRPLQERHWMTLCRTSMASSSWAWGTPLRTAYSRRCSRTVSIGYRMSCWGHTPSEFLMLDISPITSLPTMKALPPVVGVMPVSMASSVVCLLKARKNQLSERAKWSVSSKHQLQSIGTYLGCSRGAILVSKAEWHRRTSWRTACLDIDTDSVQEKQLCW